MIDLKNIHRGALLNRGKVRDTYATNDPNYLWVEATNRLSIFDVPLQEPVRGKGAILTHMSKFWFVELFDDIPNHFVGLKSPNVMIVKRADMLPVEAIERGYLTGSGLKDYRQNGAICGIALPPGLQESQQFTEPLFTPSTKAVVGHDENVDADTIRGIFFEAGFDPDLVAQIAELSMQVYTRGASWARERGIIIADTKFEWGLVDGVLTLCDEVLTPDSSRFWPEESWVVGQTPPSLDKQPVRDWGQALVDAGEWDKTPPAPPCPDEVLEATTARYVQASQVLTGDCPIAA